MSLFPDLHVCKDNILTPIPSAPQSCIYIQRIHLCQLK